VPIGDQDEATALAHPTYVQVADDGWRDLKRVPGLFGKTRCACLRGDGAQGGPFRCVIYADRPSPCRELEVGEPNCLYARRRIGLSPGPT
jgi:hypothetical protein